MTRGRTRIGRYVVLTPLEVRVGSAQNPGAGISGPFRVPGYELRARKSSAYAGEAQTVMDSLEADFARHAEEGVGVWVEDLDSIIPKGHYLVQSDYEKPGGAPQVRPLTVSLVKASVGQLRVVHEAEDWDVRHIGATTDIQARGEKYVAYTPDTTERVVARIGSSLVLSLRMSSNANDSSGLGNHGTLNGGAAFIGAGKVGDGLALDGVDDYVSIPDHPTLDLVEDFTLEAWLKPDVITGGVRYVVSKVGGGSGYVFGQNDAQLYAGSAADNLGGGALTGGAWHQGVFTVGKADSAGARRCVLYLNGAQVATKDISTGWGANATALTVGSTGAANWFDGVLDEVRIYNRALTADEVKWRYDNTVGGTRPANDHRAPLDEAVEIVQAGTRDLRVRARVQSRVTTTQRFKAVWVDGDGATLSAGSNVSAASASTWDQLDLGTFTGLTTNAKILHILVSDPSNVNAAWLDSIEVVSA